MPTFQAVFARVGEDVGFLGINHQDNRDAALDLLKDTGVRYPSGYDPDGDIARAYELFGMPTTLFISPDGRVVGRRTGEMSRPQLDAALRKLFGVEARSAG
jgi:cytochrome c biogenesis protein CcmG/thiol:disulfide interchange protein DsbE